MHKELKERLQFYRQEYIKAVKEHNKDDKELYGSLCVEYREYLDHLLYFVKDLKND